MCAGRTGNVVSGKSADGEIGALREALRACLEFLVTEQGWEDFRGDRLYRDDDPRRSCSRENARQLRNFLAGDDIKPYIRELLP